MPLARVGSVDLHYESAGPEEGPIVLLLHGSLSSSRAWSRHLPRLAAAGYRALVLDDRGHGASTPFGVTGNPWRAFGVPTFAEDARGFLDAVAPGRPIHVVGHSRGATVAGWLAFEEEHPRIASLVVAASPPQASEAFRLHFRAVAERRAPRSPLEEATLAYLAKVPDDDFPGEALTQYRGPALVVEAGDDPLYSPTHTMFWRAWLRNAEVERVEGAGHDFLFDGGEGERRFSERLLRFLREVDA